MTKIINAPRYGIGEVIDLSYLHGGMPNRIVVTSVFWRENDTEWMYQVRMENNNELSRMAESFIMKRESSKSAKVYDNVDVIRRIRDGYRFCGNYPTDEARGRATFIANAENISDVRLYPALYPNNTLAKGKKGIWIRYNTPIADDGTTHNIFMGDGSEIIKSSGAVARY